MVIFHTGVGAVSAGDHLRWFWRRHADRPVDCVIGAGFAGGLDLSLKAGELILANNYPDCIATAQALLGNRARVGPLVTVPSVLETPEAKAEVARDSGAIAADMETATVAAFFHLKGVPFLALRAISDVAGDTLPVPSRILFDEWTQKPRPRALFRFLLCNPSRMIPFLQFILAIRRARKSLAEALVNLLAMSPHLQKQAGREIA